MLAAISQNTGRHACVKSRVAKERSIRIACTASGSKPTRDTPLFREGDRSSPREEPQPPTRHKTELAARLKQLSADHGLSLSQLARATDISSSFLSLVEQAQSDISIGRLVRLAEFYDVELADLLNGPPTAPSDHVRILRTAPDHVLHSPTEGVDVYDLTCGARWTIVPTLSSFRPGGRIEIDDEHEHERMIYILDGTFELAEQITEFEPTVVFDPLGGGFMAPVIAATGRCGGGSSRSAPPPGLKSPSTCSSCTGR